MTAFRLEIAPGDHFDVVLKPYSELTVEEHVRIFEEEVEETKQDYLHRAFGVPKRFARVMKPHEVDMAIERSKQWMEQNDARLRSMREVIDTLKDFQTANERPWTLKDAREILEQHGIYRDRIEAEGRTFIAPKNIDLDTSAGQWSDLEEAMIADKRLPEDQRPPESLNYCKVLSILMQEVTDAGVEVHYPAQHSDESDNEYGARLGRWLVDREALFRRCRWVDVAGVAAFFFSRSDYARMFTSHRWTLFQELTRQR